MESWCFKPYYSKHTQTQNKSKSQGWGRQRRSVHVWAKSISSPRCIPASYQILRRTLRNNRPFQYKSWEQSIPYESNCNSTHLLAEESHGLEKRQSLKIISFHAGPTLFRNWGGGGGEWDLATTPQAPERRRLIMAGSRPTPEATNSRQTNAIALLLYA
jgi:hypothetical protein